MRRARLGHLEPERARLDAGGAGLDVDLDRAHTLGRDEHRVLERGDRGGVVPGALRRDLEPVLAGDVDDRDHVARRRRGRRRARALVCRQVPGAAGEVPLRVGRGDDVAAQDGGELGAAGSRVSVLSISFVSMGRCSRRPPHARERGDPAGYWCGQP